MHAHAYVYVEVDAMGTHVADIARSARHVCTHTHSHTCPN